MSSAAANVYNPAQSSTFQPKHPQRQTAKDVIAENVKALIAQLEAGKSDALTAYLDAMARFHNYSFGNILAIARQKPTATNVAGMYTWNQLGRRVKKGEKGIQILAPMIGTRRRKDTEAATETSEKSAPVLVGFRAVYVFDVLSRDLRPAWPGHRAPPQGADVLLDSSSWMLGLLCLLTLRSGVQMRPGCVFASAMTTVESCRCAMSFFSNSG
jgi:hypothetical protein